MPIAAAKMQKSKRQVDVDILVSLAGITNAITSIPMKIPQKTIWLAKKNCMAAGLEATPKAQNADMSIPMNILT